MKIEQIKIDELKPYPQNARTHSNEQIQQIKESMIEFGFTNPILIDKNNEVIAGHGRLESAKQLKMQDVPCIRLGYLTETQKKAYVLADNKLALNADWNIDLLSEEMQNLVAEDFNIDVIGFDEAELLELLQTDEETTLTKKEKETKDIPQKLWLEAWEQWLIDCTEQYEILKEKNYQFSGLSVALAKIYFLKAKYLGENYPRYCSLAFHPQQFITAGDSGSVYDGLQKVKNKNSKQVVKQLIWLMQNKPQINNIISMQPPFGGHRLPADFPAILGKNYINEYANNGKVFDPCHGWGGRLVGFLLSDAEEYTGIDISDLQSNGVKKIYNSFKDLIPDKKTVNLLCTGIEDYIVEKEKYDLAITSPPYFNVENYLGDNQSHKKFNNYESWKENFYKVLIEKTYNALKKKGIFCLQVGSQKYPLKQDGIYLAKKTGFKLLKVEHTGMINTLHKTSDDRGENMIILEKN
jgi:tRNA1(Val) A37 N6-methylase TrmN6